MYQSSSAVLLLKLSSRTSSTLRNTVKFLKEQQKNAQNKTQKTHHQRLVLLSCFFNDSEYAFYFPLVHPTYPEVLVVVLWKL